MFGSIAFCSQPPLGLAVKEIPDQRKSNDQNLWMTLGLVT